MGTRRDLLIEFYRQASRMYYEAAADMRDAHWLVYLFQRKAWRRRVEEYQGLAHAYHLTASMLAGIEFEMQATP